MRPRLLDLFCGAGGAAMGYYRAGFEVVGVDINPQPHYPFEFHQADAMTYPLDNSFSVIHASPPCQGYTRMGHLRQAQGTAVRATAREDLITPLRARLAGRWYVLENVPGSPLNGICLCGSSFMLRVRRHRIFESSVTLHGLPCDHHSQGHPVGVWNWGKWGHHIPDGGRSAASLQDACDAMGITWSMTRAEVCEAIPPAYTLFVGGQLLASLEF
jgi:DNA (cytosine-5)-methyltransferase 1